MRRNGSPRWWNLRGPWWTRFPQLTRVNDDRRKRWRLLSVRQCQSDYCQRKLPRHRWRRLPGHPGCHGNDKRPRRRLLALGRNRSPWRRDLHRHWRRRLPKLPNLGYNHRGIRRWPLAIRQRQRHNGQRQLPRLRGWWFPLHAHRRRNHCRVRWRLLAIRQLDGNNFNWFLVRRILDWRQRLPVRPGDLRAHHCGLANQWRLLAVDERQRDDCQRKLTRHGRRRLPRQSTHSGIDCQLAWAGWRLLALRWYRRPRRRNLCRLRRREEDGHGYTGVVTSNDQNESKTTPRPWGPAAAIASPIVPPAILTSQKQHQHLLSTSKAHLCLWQQSPCLAGARS